MIQTSEDIIRRFCAYGVEFKEPDGFTHYWFTLIPALELAYKKSIHSSTGKTPAMLEKCCNPRLPHDTLEKDSVDIHPSESSLKGCLKRQDIMQTYVCKALSDMQKRYEIKFISHLTLK
ncbi:hypothetical protein O181_102836 [Austropuccinia psidii MF-1]|uniref:Uncharacterized protein n=1 Tax=Austropuccinia psidii MF-1 TaxID=1389203 RepID=A0A9Q3PJY0_9BASI|nr:hypothetical protein [Austropuccinia psidii MF-1]